MTNQRKGRGTKLTTTFRSWDSKEKLMGFSPEIRRSTRQSTLLGQFTNCPYNELPQKRITQQQNEFPQWIQRRKNIITKNYWPF